MAILDWIELEKLILSLKPYRSLQIRLKIDLFESDYILDLNNIPLLLWPIKKRLIALSIHLSTPDDSKGVIDM